VKVRKEFGRNYLKVVSSDGCWCCNVECFDAESSSVIVHFMRVIFEKVKFNGGLCYYSFQDRHPRCGPG
jgi:hypothetical protein